MEPYLGQIMLFAGNFAPVGWLSCNGQLLPVSQYEALFTLLGTIYGGDGQQTFALPDLRGRIPTHTGQGPGLSNVVQGAAYGVAQNQLTIAQMPAHSHSITGSVRIAASSTADEDSESPVASYLRNTPGTSTYASTADTVMGPSPFTLSLSLAGLGNDPLPNEQPTVAMNYCIATMGIFPTRS